MVEKSGTIFNFYFINLLKTLNKRKSFLILFNLIVLILIFALSYFVPHKYESFATLLPSEESGTTGLANFLQSFSNISFIGGKTSSKIQIYYEMLRSNELVVYTAQNPTIRKLTLLKGLDSNKVADLIRNGINVNLKQSGLIEVYFSFSTSFFPGKSQKTEVANTSSIILRTILETLDLLVRTRISTRSHRKRILIEQLLAEKKKQLDSIENALEIFREKNKVLSLDEQSHAILGSAIEVGSELAKAELELQLALTEYESNAPIVSSLKEKVQKLQSQYERIQAGGLTGKETFSIPLAKVPSLIRDYSSLIRSQKILEQVNVFLETQRYQEAIQEQTEIPSVDILDNPRTPQYQSFPNRPFILIITFVLSSIASILYVVVQGAKNKEYTFTLEPVNKEDEF